jgi:phosphinothricin acetyltransferase
VSGLVLRLATEDDAAAVHAIYAPIVAGTHISFEVEVPGIDEIRRRIATIGGRWPWVVAPAGGGLLGYAYACQHRERAAYQWAVDFAVYVGESARGRGVGRALYAALARTCVVLGYCNAYAGIALPNAASVRLHEAVGFRPVGVYERVGCKAGAWHDVGWWQLELQRKLDGNAPPAPKSLADARRDQALRQRIERALAAGPWQRPAPADQS